MLTFAAQVSIMKRGIAFVTVIALAASLSAQTKAASQKDFATFDADGTAHITRVVPMPTKIGRAHV